MAHTYPWEGNRKEFYTAIGYLCQHWNTLEMLYVHRASDLMGIKRDKHDLVFRHFGTVAIGNFLNEYAEHRIKSKKAREQLAYVVKFVDRCRINRNAIVHGWASDGDLDGIKIVSKPDQRRPKETEFTVGLKDIERVCEEIELAGRLTVAVGFLFNRKSVRFAKEFFGPSWRSRLHAKFPLPKLVMENPKTSRKPQRQHRP